MTHSPIIIFVGDRIIWGEQDYLVFVTARPDLKPELDAYLIEKGYEHLIVEE